MIILDAMFVSTVRIPSLLSFSCVLSSSLQSSSIYSNSEEEITSFIFVASTIY